MAVGAVRDLSPSLQPGLSSEVTHLKQGCLEGSIRPRRMSPGPPPDTPGCLEVATFHPEKQISNLGNRAQATHNTPNPRVPGRDVCCAKVNQQGYAIIVKATIEHCTL